ncbi:MAG: GNAT family N-acetyltransferase [Anaerohalosphaeraceae bacterium]
MIIREATKEDVPKIFPVWRELMEFHAERDLYWKLGEGAHEAFSKHLIGVLEKEDTFVFVAYANDNIIAYCRCSIVQRPPVFATPRQYGSFSELAVVPKYRRKGVGERMVEHAVEWFLAQGVLRIEVQVSVSNEISAHFWKKMGFTTYLKTMYQSVDLTASA